MFRFFKKFGVPNGSRTRVAAVKEKRPVGIQRNLAAWIGDEVGTGAVGSGSQSTIELLATIGQELFRLERI